MKHIFIVNPTAGDGGGRRLAKRIERICEQHDYAYEIRFTTPDCSGKEIAADYVRKAAAADRRADGKAPSDAASYIFWAVGGDGTLHDTLNGMAGSPHFLGLIPFGSGNDFARTLGELSEPVTVMDVGRINERYFLNTVCFGLDGQVANNVDLMRQAHVPAKHRYTASILYTFVTHREKLLKFSWDGKEEQMRSTMLTVCNGRYYGGGYCIAPKAQLNDGLFDFFYAPHIRRLAVIPLFLKLMKGRLSESPKVHSLQTTGVKIHAEEEVPCNVDGEVIRGTDFDICIVPRSVNFYSDAAFVNEILHTS